VKERERKYKNVNNPLTPSDVTISSNIIKKMGKHPNTNWILKTKICSVMRGHKSCRGGGWRFLVYILKAFRVLVNVTEQTISVAVITGHVPRRSGVGGLQIFHTRYNYSASPVRSSPVTTPLPQYTHAGPSTSIYYKTDNSKMNGQSV